MAAGAVAGETAAILVALESATTHQQFACRLRQICRKTTAVPLATGQALADACLRRDFHTAPPAALCDIVDAFAQQRFVHSGLTTRAMERMTYLFRHHGREGGRGRHGGEKDDFAVSPQAARSWLESLVAMRTPMPASHLDACLEALGVRSHASGFPNAAGAAAPLLRTLLLARLEQGVERQPLRHGMAMTGFLLAAAARSGDGSASNRAALADCHWLLRHSPPDWWQPSALAAHHAAMLQAPSQWGCALGFSGARSSPQARDCLDMPSAHGGSDLNLQGMEESVMAALFRLRCKAARGNHLGHLQLGVCLPELRVVLDCLGPPPGQLRYLEEEVSSQAEILPPDLALRHAQLRAAGWLVEVIRPTEWPSASSCMTNEASVLERKEEILLRRKLAGALQRHVPPRRRAHWISC